MAKKMYLLYIITSKQANKEQQKGRNPVLDLFDPAALCKQFLGLMEAVGGIQSHRNFHHHPHCVSFPKQPSLL